MGKIQRVHHYIYGRNSRSIFSCAACRVDYTAASFSICYAARMASEPIQYFNRYTGRIEIEDVYGDRFLRWTYGNPLGRLSLHTLVKRAAFSRWYGRRMDAAASRRKVAPFIANYRVDAEEFAETPESYCTFNEF